MTDILVANRRIQTSSQNDIVVQFLSSRFEMRIQNKEAFQALIDS